MKVWFYLEEPCLASPLLPTQFALPPPHHVVRAMYRQHQKANEANQDAHQQQRVLALIEPYYIIKEII